MKLKLDNRPITEISSGCLVVAFSEKGPLTPSAGALDEASGEFVELVNLSDQPRDAAGLVLSDGDSVDVLIGYQGGPTVIDPGGYGLILDPDYADEYTIPGAAVLLTVASSTTLGNGLATTEWHDDHWAAFLQIEPDLVGFAAAEVRDVDAFDRTGSLGQLERFLQAGQPLLRIDVKNLGLDVRVQFPAPVEILERRDLVLDRKTNQQDRTDVPIDSQNHRGLRGPV